MKSCKGRSDIRPIIELVPSEVKLIERRLIELLELEPRADAIENFSMQKTLRGAASMLRSFLASFMP